MKDLLELPEELSRDAALVTSPPLACPGSRGHVKSVSMNSGSKNFLLVVESLVFSRVFFCELKLCSFLAAEENDCDSLLVEAFLER